MQHINEWMLKALRADMESLQRMPLQWLEFERNNWSPLIKRAIAFMLNGGTFLLCTDSNRRWLQYYILSKLNTLSIQRPYVPIYGLDESLIKLLDSHDYQALQDVLNMSYRSYALWYIGKTDNKIAQFALEISESILVNLIPLDKLLDLLSSLSSNLSSSLISSFFSTISISSNL